MKQALLLTLSAAFLSFGSMAQTMHTIQGAGTQFTPDTLIIAPGDSIHFTTGSLHSMTEVDFTDWQNNTANPNGGFDVGSGSPNPTADTTFVINYAAGTYYFVCRPHITLGGMKGVLIVDSAASVQNLSMEAEAKVFPNPASDHIRIGFPGVQKRNVTVFNPLGQQVYRSSIPSGTDISVEGWAKGIYTVVVEVENERIEKKIVVE